MKKTMNLPPRSRRRSRNSERVVLPTGFELVEASACVDPENYSEKYGAEICMEKIKDRLWFLMGFALQWAHTGLKAGGK